MSLSLYETLKEKAREAVSGTGDRGAKRYRSPRLVPVEIDGVFVWVDPDGMKVDDYVEDRVNGVVVKTSYTLRSREGTVEKVQLSLVEKSV